MTKIDLPQVSGFIELVDSMGSDLTVVNSARVSYNTKSNILNDKDTKLIKYLAAHKHWSPFRGVQFQFRVQCPELVARQWYKHVVGCEYTSGDARTVDHHWSEASTRYTEMSGYWQPTQDSFRAPSQTNKQSSEDTLNSFQKETALKLYNESVELAFTNYKKLLELGVCREQARAVLPLGFLTTFIWTASLQAVVNFIELRKAAGAQEEIRCYAEAIKTLIRTICPNAVDALLGE